MSLRSFHTPLAFLWALSFTILPLPQCLLAARPPFVLLVLLRLFFLRPEKCSFGLILLLGFFLDVLLSTVMGEHSFALCTVLWLANGKLMRLRFLSFMEQILFVAFLCFLYQSILFILSTFLGENMLFSHIIESVVVSALIWPFFSRVLGNAKCSAEVMV